MGRLKGKWESYKADFRQRFLPDARGAAVRAYKAMTTSIVVLLDADGQVAYTGVGSGQDLLGAVEKLLGN